MWGNGVAYRLRFHSSFREFMSRPAVGIQAEYPYIVVYLLCILREFYTRASENKQRIWRNGIHIQAGGLTSRGLGTRCGYRRIHRPLVWYGGRRAIDTVYSRNRLLTIFKGVISRGWRILRRRSAIDVNRTVPSASHRRVQSVRIYWSPCAGVAIKLK